MSAILLSKQKTHTAYIKIYTLPFFRYNSQKVYKIDFQYIGRE